MHFGKLVRDGREAIGWSQVELGERVGVTGTQISRIETGVRSASMEVFRKLVSELSLSPTDVLASEPVEELEHAAIPT